jgi:hypothetical protein
MLEIGLGENELVDGRPFTDPDLVLADAQALRRMCETVRLLMSAGLEPPERWVDAGCEHWLAVSSWPRLRAARSPAFVGFFSEARAVDHGPIVDLEHRLVARLTRGEELLAYYNLLSAGRYTNLVLFSTETAKRAATDDADHREAVSRAHAHYGSVRLHVGHLDSGFRLVVEKTRYIAFGPEGVTWRAVRPNAPGRSGG